eukprot:m.52673 g.52673  ORF g.52673 m.52673 type:complete len:120 (+) comp12727_c0_seq1:1451-1810(+)
MTHALSCPLLSALETALVNIWHFLKHALLLRCYLFVSNSNQLERTLVRATVVWCHWCQSTACGSRSRQGNKASFDILTGEKKSFTELSKQKVDNGKQTSEGLDLFSFLHIEYLETLTSR